jgi:hypothetical protein
MGMSVGEQFKKLARALQAADKRAAVSSRCPVCGRGETMRVEAAEQAILFLARRISGK